MKKPKFLLLAALGLLLMTGTAHAVDTSVSASAGAGDNGSAAYVISLNQTYEPLFSNSFGELKPTAELGGTYWTRKSDSVWGGFLTPGLRLTLFTDSTFQPYLAGAVGGIVLTDNEIGPRDLGSHALFRSKGSIGVQFGEELRHRVQGDYTNHSTWGLSRHDDGYNTYGVSYGYSF